ncbi:kelch-like protein 40b [Drosophila eugracilis]|uniref:kelch-like protein 40b n=1 Tax=Drosophila eugracilis TaxID=29029 RepID=UPI0007E75F81|nr:kelch-like protein 40b [Drosophila eugracilis]
MSTDEKDSSSLEKPPSSTEVKDKVELWKINKETKELIIKNYSGNGNSTWETLPECSLAEMGFAECSKDIKFRFEFGKENIIRKITNILQNKIGTDMVVHVGDQDFPCHWPVLYYYSEYFKKFEKVNDIFLSSDKVTPKGFQLVYEWMTDINAEIPWKNFVDLYMAVDFLKISELHELICCRLDNPKLLSGFEAFKFFLQTLPLNSALLQDLMLTRINKYFLLAVATEEYLNLEPKHVFNMLNQMNMCVNSEMEMFMSGVRWLLYDWPNRKQYAVTIMQAIRFNLMPAWYTTSLKSKHQNANFQELLDISEVQTMINLGMSFSVTHNFLDPISPLREPLQMQKPHDRQWVFNPKVSHHHRCECPKWRFLSIDVFNQYLQDIINAAIQYVPSLENVKPGQLMPCCQEALEKKSLNT